MASILKVDDLRGNTAAGNITITSEGGSATMQLQQGVAKAWGQFDFDTSIPDSFNVSSYTDHSVGNGSMVFTNNMNNAFYSYHASNEATSGNSTNIIAAVAHGGVSTSSLRGVTGNYTGAEFDVDGMSLGVHGDLA